MRNLALLALLGGVLVLVVGVALVASGADANTTVPPVPDTSAFRLPWTAGDTYSVNQNWGFGCTYNSPPGTCSHDCKGGPANGYNCYAYDFGVQAGTSVRASAGGTVEFASAEDANGACNVAYKYVYIRHSDGSRTFYLHLDDATVQFGDSVAQGAIIGHSGCTGSVPAHLHFQRDDGPSGNSAGPYSFYETGPRMLQYDESVTSQNSPPTPTPTPPSTPTPVPTPTVCPGDEEPPSRIGDIRSDGRLYIKEGSLSNPWLEQATNATQLCLSHDRIGHLGSGGRFYVKEGSLSNPWLEQATDVVAIALSGDRIGQLRSDGRFYVKEGSLSNPWLEQATDVVAIAVTGDRIGQLRSDGRFYVKEGSLSNPWLEQATNVVAIAVTGDRIGHLGSGGRFYVKEGSLSNPWLEQATDVVAIAVTGDQIGQLRNDGRFYIKEGSLSNPWLEQATNVVAIALTADRIGHLGSGGRFYVKEGSLSNPWLEQATDVVAIALSGGQAVEPLTPTPTATPTATPTPTAPDADGDGCTALQEAGPNEALGGRRDDLNPWDFYDTDGNKVIDLFIDIFTVAFAFGDDADSDPPGEPDGYDANLDRSAPLMGEDVWDMQAPDGLIDLFTDIFGVAFQFGHSCA